jgi:CRISPR/Cas system-associated exonuclease Cas4 (RecB family)
MTKNLLKQVMIKSEPKEVKKKNEFDISGLVDTINAGYLKDCEPKTQTKYSFAPSTLAYNHGECPRYWYFAFSGVLFEDNSNAFGVANRTNGVKSHERIEDAILKSGIAKIFKNTKKGKENEDTTEFQIKNENPPILGYGDAIINWNDKEVVLDVKTADEQSFEYRKRTGKPKKDHVIQLLIYMKILGHKHGILLYENKNTFELLPIVIEVNDYYREWTNSTFEWMLTVRAAWMKNTLPIKNYRSNSKICKGCPVQKACEEAGPGVVKIASLEGLSETM